MALRHHRPLDAAPGPGVGPGERRHLFAPAVWLRLPAGNRPEGHGPCLCRDGLAARAISGRRHGPAGRRRRARQSHGGLADDRGRFRLGPACDDGKDGWKPAGLRTRERRFGRCRQHRLPRGLAGNLAQARTGHRQQPSPAYYQGSDSRDAPGDWESPGWSRSWRSAPVRPFASRCRSVVPMSPTTCWSTPGNGSGRRWSTRAPGPRRRPATVASSHARATRPCWLVPRDEVFAATLELVTPAFLAGANQEADDCQLRTATLRGLLRWWWRTMHAGFVDVATLRRLETTVWGDVNTAAPSASPSSRRPRSSPSCTTTRNVHAESGFPARPSTSAAAEPEDVPGLVLRLLRHGRRPRRPALLPGRRARDGRSASWPAGPTGRVETCAANVSAPRFRRPWSCSRRRRRFGC